MHVLQIGRRRRRSDGTLARALRVIALAAFSAAMLPGAAGASDIAACIGHIASAEKANEIPEGVLRAIGFAESGRTVDGSRGAWPWTVNAQGQGHYFESKSAAVEFVQGLQAQGVRVIDVGCMQVNLHYHPKAFASLEDAFDPATNVAYASKFLVWLHDETKDWATASRYYHSRTPSLGRAYAARLTINSFGKVISSVGPVKRLTKAEREALATEVPARLAAVDELLAKSRAMRQPKPALTAVEQAVIAIEPAAGPAGTQDAELAASADEQPSFPSATTLPPKRSNNR
jgi:hypothetical protein